MGGLFSCSCPNLPQNIKINAQFNFKGKGKIIMSKTKSLLFTCLLGLASQTWASTLNTTESVNTWSVLYSMGSVDSFASPPFFNSSALYVGNTIASGCSALVSDSMSSVDDVKMFMNMYMLAKTSGMQMKVYYDSATCAIRKFGLAPN
jgi:hypothetical protein